jgi:RimJ/RimL family protein N-acetyltransferase
MTGELIEIKLRPFDQIDFERLISWVSTPEALGQWCGAFFRHPLDEHQLQRYLDSASQPNVRVIFTALTEPGEVVGHIEISTIWPYLSSRLSRVIVAPGRRGEGIGGAMVARAVAFSFETHHVAHIDLGVAADNATAIACYRRHGFDHVGIWPQAVCVGTQNIDVCWMTLTRMTWARSLTADAARDSRI